MKERATMNIVKIHRVLALGVFIVLAGPPQKAEARSLMNSSAVTAERAKPEVKSMNRHRWRRQHLRHRKRTHHLDPGW